MVPSLWSLCIFLPTPSQHKNKNPNGTTFFLISCSQTANCNWTSISLPQPSTALVGHPKCQMNTILKAHLNCFCLFFLPPPLFYPLGIYFLHCFPLLRVTRLSYQLFQFCILTIKKSCSQFCHLRSGKRKKLIIQNIKLVKKKKKSGIY